MKPPERFELSNIERQDPLWRKLNEYFNGRIKELRERNDLVDLDDKQTLKIRAEIAVYKSLSKLGE